MIIQYRPVSGKKKLSLSTNTVTTKLQVNTRCSKLEVTAVLSENTTNREKLAFIFNSTIDTGN